MKIKNKKKQKVLAVASAGGHWMELLRLKPAFDDAELMFMSTNKSFAKTVEGYQFFCAPEVSRWNKLKLVKASLKMGKMIFTLRPDVVISTGAAPGVLAIILGKLSGARTIWVDSMCHVEGLSMSAKIAGLFTDRIYTQWPQLATSKIMYEGNIML